MTAAEMAKAIGARFSDVHEIPKSATQVRGDELYLSVPPARLREICEFLRSDASFDCDYLSFLTAIDWKTYFEAVYYLVSNTHRHKVVLKVRLEPHDSAKAPSVISIWPAADWQERELFDLMGIHFEGHPNLRRLLLPDDWEGHPLRKDYVAKPDRYD